MRTAAGASASWTPHAAHAAHRTPRDARPLLPAGGSSLSVVPFLNLLRGEDARALILYAWIEFWSDVCVQRDGAHSVSCGSGDTSLAPGGIRARGMARRTENVADRACDCPRCQAHFGELPEPEYRALCHHGGVPSRRANDGAGGALIHRRKRHDVTGKNRQPDI